MVKTMEKTSQRPTAILLVVIGVVARLLPHPANFTPLGASALFSGAKIGRPWNYLLPLAALFISDLFLGFHKTVPYVYGSFILITFLGERFASQTKYVGRLAGLAVLSSVLFYLITNFGVWASSTLYPHTLAGLIQSYVMGLPFLRPTLAGDIIYTIGIFGAYQLASVNPWWTRWERKLATIIK